MEHWIRDTFVNAVLVVVAWELLRFSFKKTMDYIWEKRKEEMMEECPFCFEKVPNLEFHKPRCRNKPRPRSFTYLGRSD